MTGPRGLSPEVLRKLCYEVFGIRLPAGEQPGLPLSPDRVLFLQFLRAGRGRLPGRTGSAPRATARGPAPGSRRSSPRYSTSTSLADSPVSCLRTK